ncbi:MAG: hypothetical protein LJF04_11020 [Gemmatimonadetes bacterium]|nr:hypothetical protein [Gemmatimonadota bacterium]
MTPASRHLQAVVRGVRKHLTLRAGVAAVAWWSVLIAWVLVAAWVVAGPEGWQQGSRGPLLLDVVLVVLVGTAVALFRWGTRRWFDERRLSDAMEHAVGLRPGLLRGSLELGRQLPPGISQALAERAAERTAGELDRTPGELSGALGRSVSAWTRRGWGAAAAMAVALTFLAVSTPSRTAGAWAGLSSPLRIASKVRLGGVTVTPGDAEVPRGNDVEVRVDAPGRTSVELAWQPAGDVGHRETLRTSGGVASRSFAEVSVPIEYRVRTPDGVTTRSYRLTPVDPLLVSELKVEVIYAPHTGLPPDEFHRSVPPLRLPEGTRLVISGRTSRPLSSAGLSNGSGTTVLPMRVEGPVFQASWWPTSAGRYEWSFADVNGAPAAVRPDPLEIDLLPDSAPRVRIALPGIDTVMPLGMRQPLIVEAEDDYGLSRLEVVAYRVTASGQRKEPSTMGLDMVGTRAAMARPLLNMTQWGLLPGDHVRYYARAVDNAPRPHATQSREYVLRVPDASEIRRKAQEELDSMAAAVQRMADQADQQAEANRNRELQTAADEGQSDFAQREELKKALQDQKDLSARVDSMGDEIEALKKSMEDAGQADPQLSRDLEELQQLMSQVSDQQLRDQLDELARSLSRSDMEDANRALKDLAAQQQEFRDRLEESLDRFRRAAAQQEFRAATADAEELARQERALADALKEAKDPDDAARRAVQQRDLGDRAGQLGERMNQLQERLDQLGEQSASKSVQDAGKEVAEAQAQMGEAGRHARQQRGEQASTRADEAARKLEDAAKRLGEAQEKMMEQTGDAAREALSQAADEALALARRQAELQDQMGSGGRDRMSDLRADEESLLQGTRNLAQNLMEGTRGAIAGSRDFSEQIGRAMRSVSAVLDVMEHPNGSPTAPADAAGRVVGEFNQLALLALAGSEQMSQQEGQHGQGGRDTREQVEQLAQQQGDLTNKTGQLTPMQLGTEALKEQLQKLAEEQQRLADALSDAAEKPDARDETLGDLEALAEEAAALARQMARGRLTPDMLDRQEKLFHRLLDAGRSLENDDEISDERESKTAGVFEHNVVQPLSPEQLGALRYGLPDAEQLRLLPPAVRELVIQYFERLNRGSGGGGRQGAGSGGGR